MNANHAPWQRLAAASDALLAGRLGPTSNDDPVAAAIAVARRLVSESTPEQADPAFVQRLRAELRTRIRAASAVGEAVHFAPLATPIGRLWVAYHDGQVLRCTFAEGQHGASEAAFRGELSAFTGSDAVAEAAPPAVLARALRAHVEGRQRFVRVDLSRLTPFQRKVLEKTAEIPRGEVRPYGWIAREIGAPGATRAVGTALGHNPIPVIIPCHRVVRTDGSLGEYSGGGPETKRRILEFEGISVPALVAAQVRGERLRGSRTTHIVCYPTCHAAVRIRPENAVPFASLAMARRNGYRPCEKCRPA